MMSISALTLLVAALFIVSFLAPAMNFMMERRMQSLFGWPRAVPYISLAMTVVFSLVLAFRREWIPVIGACVFATFLIGDLLMAKRTPGWPRGRTRNIARFFIAATIVFQLLIVFRPEWPTAPLLLLMEGGMPPERLALFLMGFAVAALMVAFVMPLIAAHRLMKAKAQELEDAAADQPGTG